MPQKESDFFYSRLLAGVFVFTLFSALFLSYPEAVFPPALFDFQPGPQLYSTFIRSLPSVEILAPLAIAIILVFRPADGFPFLGPFLIIVASILIHSVLSRVSLEESFRFLGMAVIPYSTFTLYQKRILTLNSISIAFSVLWLHQIFLGFFSITAHESVVGLPGNINWMAALLLATCPWASHRLYRVTPSCWLPVYRLFPAAIITLPPTLILMWYCQSRGAWLSLILLPVFSCYLLIRNRFTKLVFLLTLLFISTVSMYASLRFLPEDYLNHLSREVRVPMWKASLKLLKEHPLGVGPGNFQKYFALFRTESGYAENQSATDSTIHPHNEPLNIAASIGLPGMFAFLLLGCSIFKRKTGERSMLFLARCSAFTLFFHSLFDLVLVQMPCSLVALICAGLALGQTENRKIKIPPTPGPPLLWILLGASLAGFIFVRDAIFDQFVINAHVQAATGNPEQAYQSLLNSEKLKPGSLENLYQAAELLKFTDIPGKKAVATRLYRKIFKDDPSYSHVNLFLALELLATGEYREAEDHLIREERLFPLSSAPLSSLYMLYYKTGQFIPMKTVHEKLLKKLLGKYTLVSKKDLPDLVSDWVRLTEAGERENSIKSARRLSGYVPPGSTDPALNEMTKLFSWPDFAKNGVNALDFFYWSSRLKMFDWIDRNRIRENDLIYFLEKFRKKFEITGKTDYEPPGIAWDNKRINPTAAVHLLTELVRMTGGEVVLEKAGDQEGIIYTLFKEKYYSIQFPEWDSYPRLTSRPDISWQGGKTLVFLPIQSFYLHTRIFQAFLEKFLPTRTFLVSGFPSLTVLKAMEIFPPNRDIKPAPAPDAYMSREELDYVIKNIKAL